MQIVQRRNLLRQRENLRVGESLSMPSKRLENLSARPSRSLVAEGRERIKTRSRHRLQRRLQHPRKLPNKCGQLPRKSTQSKLSKRLARTREKGENYNTLTPGTEIL